MAGRVKAKSVVKEINSSGLSMDERMQIYTEWTESYDEDVQSIDYQGPRVTAETLAEYVKAGRDTYSIIDIAAGTGLVGEELYKLGFRTIDALDPSQSMLDAAKRKNVYQNFFCEFVTDKPIDKIPENSYDALTISGGMINGHLQCSAVPEFIRLVKPGGYIIMVTKYSNLETIEDYKGRLEPLIDQLEAKGMWKKIKFEKFDNYYMGLPGVTIVYQVC